MDSEVANNLHIYPNPSHDVFYLQSADPIQAILISDIAGNIIFRSNTSLQQVNLHDFPSGLYLLTIQTNHGHITKRIMKE